ncbi:hypothetical protein RMCBS344292_11894 [Rhizopus microsporus]|nr:hypothetical protein RMCBS344292_11894 [Rhizopus microsporus]
MSELPTLTEEQLQRIAANKARALEKLKAKRELKEQEEKKDEKPLKRARWIKSFYEYDLSTLKDSKAGFIVEEDTQKEEKEENRYVAQPYYPPSADPSENPKCKECGSIDLDPVFFNVFHMNLCPICKERYPEKYSLITKTEAKEDYLLTDRKEHDQHCYFVLIF